MKAVFDIYRKKAGETGDRRQTFELPVRQGEVILDVFHRIQENDDPSFAYRYSCRGAICGSCAVRINGTAGLACKTQVLPLAEMGAVKIDPLINMTVIKDLVCDFSPFWEAYRSVEPFLQRPQDVHDEKMTWDDKLPADRLDQLKRCIDCIKCAACFSDCPKRYADDIFVGPAACVELFKFFFDPRDGAHEARVALAGAPGGVIDCESHANCLRVCPKDVRPLRAINFMRKYITQESEE
jgi:succinate dehydrogenase / fumarate reductase iron-sulfur subunit